MGLGKSDGRDMLRGLLLEELIVAGVEVVRRIDEWFGHDYHLLFRKP